MTTIGSAGDINPYVAIGRELVRRGHEVAILVHPYLHPRLSAMGIRCYALGGESRFRGIIENPSNYEHAWGSIKALHGLIDGIAWTLESCGRIVQEWRPQVVVRNATQLGVRWVFRKYEIPSVVGVLAPRGWLSLEDRRARAFSPTSATRTFALSAFLKAVRPLAFFFVERHLHRIARKLGLESPPNLLQTEWLAGDAALGLWSPTFRGPGSLDPPHGKICGFSFFDAPFEGGDGWARVEEFLGQGEAPIAFSLGTAIVHSSAAEDFCRHGFEA
ncbi:MAG TPA: glycosyltransferase, partial [Planctomycetota bacterium]|nr:glycosyltransferase [Planctomycetota bacterium]